jgi:hypothetical protein
MPVAASVPRVLRCAEPATPDAARASTAAVTPSSAAAQATTSSPAISASPNVPAPFDVEHLAERVVRVIDRRLVAARERFGRI